MDKHPILLVDDEPEILFSLRGLLRQEFELHTAEGGAEALDLLRRTPVHVVMADQRMPGMTGAEFLRRSRDVCPNAVRIMFTGYADLRAANAAPRCVATSSSSEGSIRPANISGRADSAGRLNRATGGFSIHMAKWSAAACVSPPVGSGSRPSNTITNWHALRSRPQSRSQ